MRVILVRKKYREPRLNEVLEFFLKNIDEVKFLKAWIEKALEENYVDNTVYKNQLVKKEEEAKIRHEKIKELQIIEREVSETKAKIYDLKIDIEFYKDTGHLKPGDMMHFLLDYSIEDAIEELESRVRDNEKIVLKKAECEKLR